MQALAAWLVARPLNAILGLAATISLGYLSFLGGAVLVMLVLRQGPGLAAIELVAAAALATALATIFGTPASVMLTGAIAIWLPALVLGMVLARTRSLTLTIQVAALVAVAGVIGFAVAVDNPAGYWRDTLLAVAEVWRQAGMNEQADFVVREIGALSQQMTVLVAMTAWTLHVATCVLGYLLYRQLPGETARYGRFRELNLGRVIALATAVASVVAFASGAVWLQNIALVMLGVFWLQGLAIVHWLHGEGHLPVFGVAAVYVLMPILNLVLLVGLAVTGYVDAWFGFRRPRRQQND